MRILRGAIWVSATLWSGATLCAPQQVPTEPADEATRTATVDPSDSSEPQRYAEPSRKVPLELQPYKVKVLVSFSNDATLTPRLRADVMRRIRAHAAAFVGDVWRITLHDVSRTLELFSHESIAGATTEAIEPFGVDQDKVFLLGIRVVGDQFVLASREFDVFFARWGPVFTGTARERSQIARELVLLSARMFSPLARLETGDARRVTVSIKGGRLPTLNRDAIDPRALYKPSFQFVPTGTLLRAMQPVYNEDRTEILGMAPKGWTFYVVESRDREIATCKIDSAMKNTLPPVSEDPDDPQLIVTRSARGSTTLRLVDTENRAPLPAMDVELIEIVGGASFPLGTTDSDGRISIPPNRTGNPLVWAIVRHGRDTLARLPIMPGAGDEPDLALNPDAVRLDIEGRVMAVQTQIVDQVARRTILAGNLNPFTQTLEGGMIRKAIEKKDWAQAESLLQQLKQSPSDTEMTERLEAAKEYAREQRAEDKWTGKLKRLFAETEKIIESYFDPNIFADTIGELEDDLRIRMEDAAAEAAEGKADAAAAPTGNTES